MTGKDIIVKGADGNFGAYLASPASGHGPGVVVIQEIFGVNGVVRQICDYHAARGRFALAPDLVAGSYPWPVRLAVRPLE